MVATDVKLIFSLLQLTNKPLVMFIISEFRMCLIVFNIKALALPRKKTPTSIMNMRVTQLLTILDSGLLALVCMSTF